MSLRPVGCVDEERQVSEFRKIRKVGEPSQELEWNAQARSDSVMPFLPFAKNRGWLAVALPLLAYAAAEAEVPPVHEAAPGALCE